MTYVAILALVALIVEAIVTARERREESERNRDERDKLNQRIESLTASLARTEGKDFIMAGPSAKKEADQWFKGKRVIV